MLLRPRSAAVSALLAIGRAASSSRWTGSYGAVTALVLGLAASPGCSGRPEAGAAGAASDAADEEIAAPVVVAEAKRGRVVERVVASSTIEAERMVTVTAETSGRITKLAFEEGDLVKDGALLATIRRDAQSSSLERAAVSLEKAQADLKRIESLHARGVASDQELDNARNTVETARIDRKDRRRDVGNTRIEVPFGGTVTERHVNEGGFVSVGAQVATIADFETLVARVWVPEKELDRIALGQVAHVEGKAAKNRKGEGKVSRIAPVVDKATGTVKVTVALPAELAGPTGFLPGMYAEVVLETAVRDDALLVPKPALVRQDDQVFVFVAKEDRVQRLLVETGLAEGDLIEITKGLDVGAMVVVAGQSGLKDGALVSVVDAFGRTGADAASVGAGQPTAPAPPKDSPAPTGAPTGTPGPEVASAAKPASDGRGEKAN
jgi:RND family efflux transporter MFP subunit